MAARRAWVIFIDSTNNFVQSDTVGGMYTPYRDENKELLSVFFRESQAIEAAKYLATQYPGKDVHVLKQTLGFSCQSKPVEYKEWTEDGHFVPVSK